MKQCFKCKECKPLAEFYKHPRMADGHLGKCKDCTRADVQKNYKINREHYLKYEAARQQLTRRRKLKQVYLKRHCDRYPERACARRAVAYAIKCGRLQRLPCEVCGEVKSEAHHHDYAKPLEVQWLCFKHHREIGHGQKVG